MGVDPSIFYQNINDKVAADTIYCLFRAKNPCRHGSSLGLRLAHHMVLHLPMHIAKPPPLTVFTRKIHYTTSPLPSAGKKINTQIHTLSVCFLSAR
ncbi:hypothetical protein L1887_11073 [Cichorium endivia]|nr:hypothetical protein L1887_11073 [Cichorium endivia]